MRIGTRGSALALWQARTVQRLIAESGGPSGEIVIIRTSGDEPSGPPDAPTSTASTSGTLGTLGAEGAAVKRAFVKEIEDALLDGRIDVAVHSAKDLPAELPDGLLIAAALEREDPRDALLLPASRHAVGFDAVRAALGDRPRIGTSSVRRTAALRGLFLEATFPAIRGNVDTRLRKLDAGDCDAIVLAVAGLKRLGLDVRVSAALPADLCVPAPGQGIVAVEIAVSCAPAIRGAVKGIADVDSEAALLAERAVVRGVGGGCQMPLGALARVDEHHVTIDALVTSHDGARTIRAQARGNRGNPAAVGEKLAAQLLSKGAADLLK